MQGCEEVNAVVETNHKTGFKELSVLYREDFGSSIYNERYF